MNSIEKRTSPLVLLAAFLLSVALPCIAVARPPVVDSTVLNGVDSSSGDPIDGERKIPIIKDGGYVMEMQSEGLDTGGAVLPLSQYRPLAKSTLWLPPYVGIPGVTPFLVLHLPWLPGASTGR